MLLAKKKKNWTFLILEYIHNHHYDEKDRFLFVMSKLNSNYVHTLNCEDRGHNIANLEMFFCSISTFQGLIPISF